MLVQLVSVKNKNGVYEIPNLDINESVDFGDIQYEISFMKSRDEVMGNALLREDFKLLNVLEDENGDLFALVETN